MRQGSPSRSAAWSPPLELRHASIAAAARLFLSLPGCESAYYSAWEKVGFAKRDILTSRVESARDSQQEAKKDVESVGEALFKEWKTELAKYSSADLRSKSEQQLKMTRARYDEMIRAIAEANRFISGMQASPS